MGKGQVKNPGDGRYLKSRHRLFYALNQLIISRSSLSIRPVELYKSAHLCKSTFYHHFTSIPEVFQAESDELIAEFQTQLAKLYTNQHKPDLPHIFTHLTIHILRHPDFYSAIFASHHHAPLEKPFYVLRPQLTHDWRRFTQSTDNRIFTIYIKTTLPILEDWYRRDFSRQLAGSVVQRLVLHTEIFAAHISTFRHLADAQITHSQTNASSEANIKASPKTNPHHPTATHPPKKSPQ